MARERGKERRRRDLIRPPPPQTTTPLPPPSLRGVGYWSGGGGGGFPFNIPPFHPPLQRKRKGERGGRGSEEAIRLVIRSRQGTIPCQWWDNRWQQLMAQAADAAAAGKGDIDLGRGKVTTPLCCTMLCTSIRREGKFRQKLHFGFGSGR